MRERLEAACRDLAYAARTLGRQPGFASVVIVTLALGIGANATMFGVVDRLLLRPPPHIARAHEVLEIGHVGEYNRAETITTALHYPLYARLRAAEQG